MSWLLKKISRITHGLVGGAREPVKVLLLGLDAAGKTTLLYMIKPYHENIETVIPTIGFNLETLTTRSNDYKCWDVGGCDKIRPLWRHYMTDLGLLVFVVDSNDYERFEDATSELKYMLEEDCMLNTTLLILANKQDLPRARSAGSLVNHMKLHGLTGRDWYVLPTTLVGVTDSVWKVCSWLEYFASNNLAGCKSVSGILYKLADGTTNIAGSISVNATQPDNPPPAPAQSDPGDSPAVAKQVIEHDLQKVESMKASWLVRDDEEEELFLARILDGTAEVWDHYVHIRLAYVYVTKHGIKQGFNLVSHAIRTYLGKKGGKQSFHPTMTNFWCHMLSYAVYTLHSDAGHVSLKELVAALFSHEQLATFELWSGRTFSKWYSNAVIFSAEARASVVRPDLQDLPSLLDLIRHKPDLSQLPSHEEDVVSLLEPYPV